MKPKTQFLESVPFTLRQFSLVFFSAKVTPTCAQKPKKISVIPAMKRRMVGMVGPQKNVARIPQSKNLPNIFVTLPETNVAPENRPPQ